MRLPALEAIVVQADVSNLADLQTLIDRGWEAFGSVDILVNNAGMEKKADFWDVTEEDYDHVLGVNLKGPFFLTQAFVRQLTRSEEDRPHHQHQLRPRRRRVSRICQLLRKQGRPADVDAHARGGTRSGGIHGQQRRAGSDRDAR